MSRYQFVKIGHAAVQTIGPLAHLVEHFHGMEGVAGSNPAWSTLERAG